MAHATLPPSGAESWGKCPGWVLMNAWFPQDGEDSEASKEGTEAHEMCAFILNGGVVTAENDMYEATMQYVEDISAVMHRGELRIEQPVSVHRIHKACWGTPDASLYDKERNTLFVWDFKYGYNPVDVFENAQLVCYTAGLMDHYGCRDTETTVVMRIVQPRAYHDDGTIREWTVLGSDLRAQINLLANAAERAMQGGDCASGTHCRYCNARHACPTALQAGVQLYEVANEPIPTFATNQGLAVQYAIVKRALDQLKYIKTGLEEELKQRIKSGQIIPNWMLKQTYGKRTWNVSKSELFDYGDSLGIDLRSPPEAISPTQFEKTNPEAYSTLEAFVHRPVGALKLAPINPKKIREVFSK